MPEPLTTTPAVVEPETSESEGDHDRFAHYARKSDILKSAVSGKPVIALCGKVWVPSRDPDRYTVCPTCKEIFERKKATENGG
jgi:hypothetical protein